MDEARDPSSSARPYWRSPREAEEKPLASPAVQAEEGEDFNLSELSPISRKRFLALLTASAAFAAAGCTDYRDKGEIVPYNRKPEEVTPGVENFYASTCTGCSQACGILIRTREGRPIKVDGNPDHPVNRGAVCVRGQASILDMYDPNRLRNPRYGSKSPTTGALTWDTVDREVRRVLARTSAAGKKIALVTGRVLSPSARSVLADFAEKYPGTEFYSYEFFHDTSRRSAWKRCYGSEMPVIAWERARVIVAFEADFIGTEGETMEQIRKFAAGRDIMKSPEFNRLYAFEGAVSLTGANADYRLRVRPDAQMELLSALMNEIALVRRAATLPEGLKGFASASTLEACASKHGLAPEILRHCVDDLLSNRGASILIAGETLPEDVHVAVNALNELLGNGAVLEHGVTAVTHLPLSTQEEWERLLGEMHRGEVGVVIHLGTNPVFHLPPQYGYREALKKVPLSVSLIEQDDETAEWCTYVLPANHDFESWGDFQVRSNVLSLQQPVIEPLYDTRQPEAVLLSWSSADGLFHPDVYHQYLLHRWEKDVYPSRRGLADFRSYWVSALHDGAIVDPPKIASPPRFNEAALNGLVVPRAGGFALALRENPYIGDGRSANNGWLQELPHPISKVAWDNYAALSPESAKQLGVAQNDLLEVTVGGARKTLPVFVQAGLADRFVAIEIGYGRPNAGPIGSDVGTDVHALLGKSGFTGARVFSGASLARVPGSAHLVSTQEHHELDDNALNPWVKDAHLKRHVIREGTLEEYRADPSFLQKREEPELPTITPRVEYHGVKWAMAIDMNKCVGCNVCVSSCNVENNIPVVGKEQVGKGREMHWIRIDRYYAGSPEDPSLSHQPMLCQQCDNAPCENVCPVVATSHSPDGLNQMVYNRCVGTKYCSNNCPYKVRRFNFYHWQDYLKDGYYLQEPIPLMYNPEVTVRSRGVMEKCTFCLQRIMEAREKAIEANRPLNGNDVKTACQEACPAQAIVFGDMNDPESTISHYRKHPLGYFVLEDVNTKPNVTYIAKLKNTHPERAS